MIPDSLIVQQNRHKSSCNDVNTSHCTCMPECTQFQLLCILLSTSQHLAWKTRLTLPAPCISESCIEIKINLNFYCYTSFWSLSRVESRILVQRPQFSKKGTFCEVLPRNALNKTIFGKRAFFRQMLQGAASH